MFIVSLYSLSNHEEHVKDVIKPYDWTYTTNYMGDVKKNDGVDDDLLQDQDQLECSTDETIDVERLKRPDPILFYGESVLYEDELADNGTAMLSIKIVSWK